MLNLLCNTKTTLCTVSASVLVSQLGWQSITDLSRSHASLYFNVTFMVGSISVSQLSHLSRYMQLADCDISCVLS